MIESHIQNFINNYKLQNKTIIVGFSGGYDSICLIYALYKLKQSNNLSLIGAHYNHNWRGEIAKSEQICCEKFCKNLGIEFYTETAPANTPQNETIARELRYEFFERAKTKYNTEIVFTAHNFNDNAETIIYRIAKGTGLTGLKGISNNRDNYFRPILDIPRDKIEEYCKQNKLTPNNDESNKDTIHKRNLIRHNIIPLLERINPNVITALNTLSKVANSELEILDKYLKTIKSTVINDNKIITNEFKKLSLNLQQKIVYDYIYNSEIDYDYKLIENAVRFINNCINEQKISKFSLTKNKFLYVDSNSIEIIILEEKNEKIIELSLRDEILNQVQNDSKFTSNNKRYEFNNHKITVEKCEKPAQNTGSEACVYVDLTGYNTLYLRTRRDGDIIQPLGFEGTMKLKKYLMSKKIPQHKRDNLILLCDGKEVLWVAGVGLSEKIKTKTVSTHKLKIKTKEQ